MTTKTHNPAFDKLQAKTKKQSGGPRAGSGRPKGVPNKISASVKQAIEEAFNGVGGAAYLMQQAQENPQAFLTLLGKIIPAQVQADVTSNGRSIADMQTAVLAALAKKHSDT
jgi:hypothetical protein